MTPLSVTLNITVEPGSSLRISLIVEGMVTCGGVCQMGRDQRLSRGRGIRKPSLMKYHELSEFNCLIELQLNP